MRRRPALGVPARTCGGELASRRVLAVVCGFAFFALAFAILPASAGNNPMFSLSGSGEATKSGCTYSDDGSVIDLLVVYTTEAKNNNSLNDINAYIQANVDIMNQCLENSGAFPRIQVVHTEELVYDDPNYNQLSLMRLLNPNDGYLDEVHTLRNTYRADLVVMFALCQNCGGTAACNLPNGNQYILTESGGFAILGSDWPVGDEWGMAHELAHTMGCGHNRDAENNGPGDPVNCRYYSYSYGYDFQGDGGQWYSTIMSYGPTRCGGTLDGAPCVLYPPLSCPPGSPCAHVVPCHPHEVCPANRSLKIPYFSNPNVFFDGQPTGVPIGSPNEADNVATINNNAFVVANFRQSGGDIWVDFDYTGPEQGCFEKPYNTFAEGVSAVPNAGTLVFKAGSSPETGLFQGAKTYRVIAYGGPVRIGD